MSEHSIIVRGDDDGDIDRSDHTFVVPAYKNSPFLANCLASLRAQTLPARILVTTSTPSAQLSATAARFGVEVIANPQQRGIGADWNFALDQVTTRYVTLAHQDDLYAPGFLAKSLDLFTRFPDATISFTNVRQINDNAVPQGSKVSAVKELLLALFVGRREIVQGLRGRLLLSFGDPVTCSSVTFDRARLGAFRFSETLTSNLDWEAWLDLIERGDHFAYSPERLVERRYNDLMETAHALRDGRRRTEDAMIFRRLWPRPVARVIAFAYSAGY